MRAIEVVELRQYTFKPGGVDTVIELFERHFIAEQAKFGAHVLGYFRDVDDPDRFVWLRGFRDMAARKTALEGFYGCDVWNEHRDAVNEALIDDTDVLLLRPVVVHGMGASGSPASGDSSDCQRPLSATIWPLARPIPAETLKSFGDEAAARFAASGATLIAVLETTSSTNNYPRLPIREGENVFVLLARLAGKTSSVGQDMPPGVDIDLAGPAHTLRLAPAETSLIR
jgi:quinol monooxygenase YgiN